MAAKPSTSGLVNCSLFSEGTELSSAIEIVSVITYKDINRIPYAFITIVDGNPSDQSFTNSENDQLSPGKELEIKAGFESEVNTIFKGDIVKIGLKVSNRNTVMTIECKDRAVKLTSDKNTKIFSEQKDSEIYSTLASDAGLSVTADATNVKHEQIVQYNSTAWDFMVLRAQANGQVVIASDNELSIKKPEISKSKVLSLDFGTNIISFETTLNAENQLKSVNAASWDAAGASESKSTGSGDSLDVGDISASDLASKISNEYNVKHLGQIASDELKDWADSIDMYRKMSKVQGVFVCFGFADVQPGNIIEVTGVGSRFSGNNYVSGVSHEIRGGSWKTKIQVGFPAQLFSEKFNYQPPKAGGLLPSINGLVCGTISKITEDPQSEYRFEVSIPVLGEDVSLWARYCLPDAGASRGLVFYPEVDDEVVLGFLDDDPRFPVILGSLHSSKNASPNEPEENNAKKGFFSKKDLKLVFDDENELISIETANGNKVDIDNKSNAIDIVDSAGNEIKLSSSGVDISSASNLNISAQGNVDISAQGNVTIGGINVELAAQASFKATGNAGCNVESPAITVVKGSLVQIN